MKNLVFIFIWVIIVSCVGLVNPGCEREYTPEFQDKKGIILYYGEPGFDGCGWMVKVDNTIYSPIEQLDLHFQKDSLVVILDYDTLESYWNCGWREPGYQQIDIKKIEL